ncbi:MAG: DUF29 domain-containing protein [Gomphosphaeria aponina SAG 52.96 = DSM 107014]|uniref:DUF29 domain-containing protein n=1 Tax=Gomphosphaeria aponina SAG 52.96 = DSM 107014 TaxID=1521640 RepID=A0A941GYW8_9CHRO|nr:DUF29 domain-containing protein [Gomphosphaeria aponina SAG 52.96 = DSM 107014]
MLTTNSIDLKELYELDDYLWIQETVKLLKEKKFQELDLENLIEELEDLGSEKRHQVESLLEQIIRHLLLLEYWEAEYERNYNHWEAEIVGFRSQINKRITTNFYNYLHDNFGEIYQDARLYVMKKSGIDTFPDSCPYTLEQLLDQQWFPQN